MVMAMMFAQKDATLMALFEHSFVGRLFAPVQDQYSLLNVYLSHMYSPFSNPCFFKPASLMDSDADRKAHQFRRHDGDPRSLTSL